METASTEVTSIRRRNNVEESTWKTHPYFFDFESRIHVEISTSNRCHNFHVDSPFKIDVISTNFPRGISTSNRWRINEDVSIRKSCSDKEINLLINESSEESQSDSEVVIQTMKKRKAPLINEFSEDRQTDSEVVNPKRNKKPPLINKTPKLESDSEVVSPKRKTKPLLINETQEDDRFAIDEECAIVI